MNNKFEQWNFDTLGLFDIYSNYGKFSDEEKYQARQFINSLGVNSYIFFSAIIYFLAAFSDLNSVLSVQEIVSINFTSSLIQKYLKHQIQKIISEDVSSRN